MTQLTFLNGIDLIAEAKKGLIPLDTDPRGGQKIDKFYCLFSDLTDAQFEKGVIRFLTSHKKVWDNEDWVPIVREYALEGFKKTGLEAWGEMLRELRKSLDDSKPEISDPISYRVAEDIGFKIIKWDAITNGEGHVFNRSQFIKNYEQMRDREAKSRLNAL